MIGTYILNYMDKVAFSEASVFGIREDLVSTIIRPKIFLGQTNQVRNLFVSNIAGLHQFSILGIMTTLLLIALYLV